MTSQVRMPYYPRVEASCVETTFGATEFNCPQLYESPIDGMRIVRVDTLECLRNNLGDNCMFYRDQVYKLVSGSCITKDEHIELFASTYRRFKSFAAFVNEIYYYGETDIPIIPRVLNPIRETINEYCTKANDLMSNAGGKFLMHTHDYLYFAFKGSNEIPELKGIKVIC